MSQSPILGPAQGPLRVVIEQPRRWFGRRLLWIALVISILANISLYGMYQSYFQSDGEIHEKFHSLNKHALDKVAIISVEGTILEGDGFVKKQIDRVRDDEHVKAVVLRVDSPGGTVTGSDYIYHHLKELVDKKKIPLVVSMGSMAASGGYYVSMAASAPSGTDEKLIFAEPTTWTGSIGVIIPHYDLTGLLEKWSIQDDSIASAPLKQMGSPTAKQPPEIREEERKILQTLVDSTFDGFKEIVLEGRPGLKNDPEKQKAVFTGQIFTARQAKTNGLVDELGFIEDAISRAVKLAKLDESEVRVVQYQKPVSPLTELLSQSRSSRLDLSALLDMSAPRAYYLCTWLPGLELKPRQ